MFTTGPHLQIRRPSPTTAEFTVTTLPPQTLLLRLLRLLLLVLRMGLALATLLLLHARWMQSPLAAPLNHHSGTQDGDSNNNKNEPPSPSRQLGTSEDWPLLALHAFWQLLARFHASPAGAALGRAAAAMPLPVLVPGALALLWLLSLRVHASESLLVLRGLGVQTREAPRTYLAGAATRFIPTEKIRDVLINEAFRGFEVRYYLVVVVDGEDDVVVVFPGLLPPRAIVETVWRAARDCLYEKGRPPPPPTTAAEKG
jgi:phosphatidylinositol N-acetylglucosaminyltransferase subunit H